MASKKNRRRHYRVSSEIQTRVSARLVVSDQTTPLAVEILDVAVGGVGLAVREQTAAAMKIGGRVTVQFRSSESSLDMDLRAQIMHKAVTGQWVRVSVAFDDWGTARERIERRLLRLFNERRLYRVQTTPRIPVLLSAPGSREPIAATTEDASFLGLGLRVAARYAEQLPRGTQVVCRLRLPATPGPIELVGEVRSIRDVSDTSQAICGLQLALSPRTHPREAQLLVEYVMQRQQEEQSRMLRVREEAKVRALLER